MRMQGLFDAQRPSTDEQDLGLSAYAAIRASLSSTLECLCDSDLDAPDLKVALEEVLSLASRRELETRVIRNIHSAQAAWQPRQLTARSRSAPYEVLGSVGDDRAPEQGITRLQRRV